MSRRWRRSISSLVILAIVVFLWATEGDPDSADGNSSARTTAPADGTPAVLATAVGTSPAFTSAVTVAASGPA